MFSGLLKCADCGSNLTIIAARGRERRAGYYGCPGHLNGGICNNDTCVWCEILEERLLQAIQAELGNDEVVSRVLRQVQTYTEAVSEQKRVAIARVVGQLMDMETVTIA